MKVAGMGVIADRSGLPVAYLMLAVMLGLLLMLLFRQGRHYFSQGEAQ